MTFQGIVQQLERSKKLPVDAEAQQGCGMDLVL
jgi:hypothetical protein